MAPTSVQAKAKKQTQVEAKKKESSEGGEVNSPIVMNADGSYSSGPLPPEKPFVLDEDNSSQPLGGAPSSAVPPSTNTFIPTIPGSTVSSFQPSNNHPFNFVPPSTNTFSANFPSAGLSSQPSDARRFSFGPQSTNNSAPNISSRGPSSQPSSAHSFSFVPPSANSSKPDIPNPMPFSSQQSGARPFSFVAPSKNTVSPNFPVLGPSRPFSSFVPPSTSVFGPAIKLDERRFSQPLPNEFAGATQPSRLDDILNSVSRLDPYVSPAQQIDKSLPNTTSTPLFQLPPQQKSGDEILFKAMPPGPAMRQHLNNPTELNRHIFLMEKREDDHKKEIQMLDHEMSDLVLGGQKKDRVIDSAKEQIKEQSQTIDKQNQQIHERDQRIAELEQGYRYLDATVGELNDKISQFDGQMNQRLESEAAKDKKIAEMKELSDRVQADVNNLTAQVNNGSAELAKANATHADRVEQLKVKDERIVELEAENSKSHAINIMAKEEIEANIEEVAELRAMNSNLNAINLKINEEIKVKDSRIAKLERKSVDAEDKYKRMVTSYDNGKAQLHEDLEEKEATIESFRKAEDEMTKKNGDLRRNIQETEKAIRAAVSNMRGSEDRVEEQAETIKEHERTINGLQATIQRLKKEREEEKAEPKLQNGGDSESIGDLYAQIERLKSEKQEMEDEHNFYIKTHGDNAKVVDAEFLLLQQASNGLESDLQKVNQQSQDRDHTLDEYWRMILGHKQTIDECEQEIQDLTEELRLYKNREMKKPAPSEGKTNDSESDNGLSQFSGSRSLQGTPEQWPSRWRARTESMYGDSDDGKDHDHDITITEPVIQGPGVAALEMCDHGTQTDATSSPILGLSQPMLIADIKPTAPDMDNQGTQTDMPSPIPKSSISKLLSTNNWSAAPDTSDQGTQASSPSLRSKFSFGEPVYIYDTPATPDMSDRGTQTDAPSSKFGISKLTTTINTPPSSAVVPTTPHMQPFRESQSRWRWLWYLLMLLVMVAAIFAAFYGESARRERQMWLKANDFTRRAVISVRAGGGTGTSTPAWLWKDQLLDFSKDKYGGQHHGLLGKR
ncbi:MAG: hypothetical protein Q9182_001061 [Xanthomendoza sp. 2 TL-2023]